MSESDASSANDPVIGLTIQGSYVIRQKIAEGGMGSVYLACNPLGLRKIVKFLLPEFSRNDVIRERFDREARAAARLAGKPHIVKIDDVGMLADGQQFMTMEFLHGKTLQSHLQTRGRLTPHEALYHGAQIARGLHELHSAGIIHRDLKPGNIFLSPDDDATYKVTLIDLGIAHDAMADERTGLRTQTGASMGTPGYMAPEQFDNAGSVTRASDVYALAVIFWEMLTGQLPWGVHDPRVIYFKQKTEQPGMSPDVVLPPGWENAFRKALSPDPAQRLSLYQFIAVLASTLGPDPARGLPGGAEIVTKFCRSMVANAHVDDWTLRASQPQQIAPMLWAPQRATQLPPTPARASFSDGIPQPAATPMLHPAQPAMQTPATAHERPRAGVAPSNPTTLSSSAGVAVPVTPAPTRVSRLVLGTLAACVLSAAVTFAAIRVRAHSSATQPTTSDSGGSASGSSYAIPAPQITARPTPQAVAIPPTVAPTPDAGVGSPTNTAAVVVNAADSSNPAIKTSVPLKTAQRHDAAKVATKPAGSRAGAASPTTPAHADGSAVPKSDKFDPDAVEE